MYLNIKIHELYNTIKNDAHHYTKVTCPKLYGLSGNDFVKAYVESTIVDKTGFTDNFMVHCSTKVQNVKKTTIERYMRASFVRDYNWIKRNES